MRKQNQMSQKQYRFFKVDLGAWKYLKNNLLFFRQTIAENRRQAKVPTFADIAGVMNFVKKNSGPSSKKATYSRKVFS